MSIPHRLVELVAERQIIPFVGAGFSAPSLMPSWRDLIRGAVQNLAPEKMELLDRVGQDASLIDVADLLDSLLPTRLSIQNYFVTQFDDPRIEPNEYHDALLDLDFDTIVTTNWDQLIEKRLQHSRVATNVIYRDTDVPRYDPSRRVQVLKIHGTVADPASLIFRKSQYDQYWNQRPLIYSLLSMLSLTRGFFFLGYRFD